jgi:hypothetical protein
MTYMPADDRYKHMTYRRSVAQRFAAAFVFTVPPTDAVSAVAAGRPLKQS